MPSRCEDGSEQVGLSILKHVEPAKVEWLAEGRAPQGALCVVAGETGTCKSLLAVEWAARTSQGTGERRCGADRPCRRYAGAAVAGPARCGGRQRRTGRRRHARLARSRATMFRWPNSIDAWRRWPPACKRAGPASCSSIDNLEAWAGGLDASPCRARIHYLLVKLAELAVRTKTAIVVLARLNGPAGGRVATRELAELSAIAPVVWLAANDAEQPGRRLLLPVKNSLGPQASAGRVPD